MTLILYMVKFPVPFIFPTAIASGGSREGRKAVSVLRINALDGSTGIAQL